MRARARVVHREESQKAPVFHAQLPIGEYALSFVSRDSLLYDKAFK